jgi:Tat protein secretion system quality control protein TatD with DNase activity
MAEYPDTNDKAFDLWLKIAQNLRESAVAVGETGLPELTAKESTHSLQRKVAVYTAALAT